MRHLRALGVAGAIAAVVFCVMRALFWLLDEVGPHTMANIMAVFCAAVILIVLVAIGYIATSE